MSRSPARRSKKANPPQAVAPVAAPLDRPFADNVRALPSADFSAGLRVLEALLFAAAEPVPEAALVEHFPSAAVLKAHLSELQSQYAGRGVHVVRVGEGWAFRTAPDLARALARETLAPRKLSRAAMETLAIIAYHQPVTRAEIEAIRGVAVSKGTLDLLLETEWVRLRGRRRTPGRPVTYGTTQRFLDQFALSEIADLPGMAELKAAGLLDAQLPGDFVVPSPDDSPALRDDETSLADGEDAALSDGADLGLGAGEEHD